MPGDQITSADGQQIQSLAVNLLGMIAIIGREVTVRPTRAQVLPATASTALLAVVQYQWSPTVAVAYSTESVHRICAIMAQEVQVAAGT